MTSTTTTLAIALLAGLTLLASTPNALAAGNVSPGHTLSFANPDYGTRQCRTGGKDSFIPCGIGAFSGTGWNVALHRVRAQVIRGPNIPFLPSAYAQGMLHNEFIVGGTPGHFVKAQISVDYDINAAQIALIANTYAEVNLLLQVRDITLAPGFNVTSHTLYQLRRDNTQGIFDVSGAQERQIKLGESGHFDVMLLTGRKYAVSFVIETMTGAFIGAGDARATAYWNRLSVSLDEDEVEMLDDIAAALEQHDQDMKARLDHVDSELREIKVLLRTPQGRRPGWNGKP